MDTAFTKIKVIHIEKKSGVIDCIVLQFKFFEL